MQDNKQKINELNAKKAKLQEAIRFKKQMASQEQILRHAQGKQQLTSIQHEIEKRKNLLIRERNNLNANIMRENINNQSYITQQVLGMEGRKSNQISNNIAQQEALKNKLDADLEENTKNTKIGLLAAGGGAALLACLKGTTGVLGTVASTLAPVFVPLLAILAVILVIKLFMKNVDNEKQKMKLTEAFEKTNENINNKDYINAFVKPYMDQLGQVDKDQNAVFQDMVGNLMKEAQLPEEYQKQGQEMANNFAKPYGLENNEFLSYSDEKLSEMVNDLSQQIDSIQKENLVNEKEQENKEEKSNTVSIENKEPKKVKNFDDFVKDTAKTISQGTKKNNKLQISNVDKNKSDAPKQATSGGVKKKNEQQVAV